MWERCSTKNTALLCGSWVFSPLSSSFPFLSRTHFPSLYMLSPSLFGPLACVTLFLQGSTPLCPPVLPHASLEGKGLDLSGLCLFDDTVLNYPHHAFVFTFGYVAIFLSFRHFQKVVTFGIEKENLAIMTTHASNALYGSGARGWGIWSKPTLHGKAFLLWWCWLKSKNKNNKKDVLPVQYPCA